MTEKAPFDDESLKQIMRSREQDEFRATMKNIAQQIHAYYQALIADGMPPALAEEMALDYHWLMAGSSWFRNGGCPPRKGPESL